MPRYFLTIRYDGTDFVGWQKQPSGRSVQGELEAALSTLARQPISIMGSGRTDAGVHARAQIAHADLPWQDAPDDLSHRLNSLLPSDIAVSAIRRVADDRHARFSATWREYRYFCTLQKDPFSSRFCARLRYRHLDVEAMNAAASHLLGEHVFRSFSKEVPEEKHYLCNVHFAEWAPIPLGEGPRLSVPGFGFRIRANRFLRGQVRALVGALLEVGSGKQEPDWIRQCLEDERRQVPTGLAPAEGLHIWEVGY